LGGYRYSAFGETLEDTVVLQSVDPNIQADNRTQPLRWKGMWRFDLGGGNELYDARARMWSPKLGTFLSVDEFAFHDQHSTLWGWPGQNSIRWGDPFGRGRGAEDGRSGFNQFLFDLTPSTLDATAGFGTGLLDNIPIWGVPGSPTAGDLSALLGLAGHHPRGAGGCAGGGGNAGDDAADTGRMVGKAVGAAALIAGGAVGKAPAQASETALHHVFPQEFAREFGQIGIDIHQFTLELPMGVHQDVHGAGWNADWKDFLEAGTSLPSVAQTQAFATELIIEYGLDGYGPLRPYR
jgi:RHS repeat-associated protein